MKSIGPSKGAVRPSTILALLSLLLLLLPSCRSSSRKNDSSKNADSTLPSKEMTSPAAPVTLDGKVMEKAAMDLPESMLGGKLSDKALRQSCISDGNPYPTAPNEIVVSDYEGSFTLVLFAYDNAPKAVAYLQEQVGIGTAGDDCPIMVFEYSFGDGKYTPCADPLAAVSLLSGDEILDHDFLSLGNGPFDLTTEEILFCRDYVRGKVEGKSVTLQWDGKKFVRSAKYVADGDGLIGYGLGQAPPKVGKKYVMERGESTEETASSWDYYSPIGEDKTLKYRMWDNEEGDVFCIDIMGEGLYLNANLGVGATVGELLEGLFDFPLYDFMYVFPGDQIIAHFSPEVVVGFEPSAVIGELPAIDNDLGVEIDIPKLREDAKIKFIRILDTDIL